MKYHVYALIKQLWDYDLDGAVDNWSMYDQFMGIDTKLAVRAVYLGDCRPTENVVFVRAGKINKGWRILCWFFRARFDLVDVYDTIIVTIVRFVWDIPIHKMVDGQERELVFK